jgi:hypothetical protein
VLHTTAHTAKYAVPRLDRYASVARPIGVWVAVYPHGKMAGNLHLALWAYRHHMRHVEMWIGCRPTQFHPSVNTQMAHAARRTSL